MSSSSQPVTSNTSTMTAPNSSVLPYAQYGLTEASRLYGGGAQSPLVNQAGGYLQNVLSGGAGGGIGGDIQSSFARGDPGSLQAKYNIDQSLTDTAGGKFLGANPYLDQMYQSASRPVIDQIQGQFSKAGRYGSAANQDVLGRTLGELSGNIYGQDYARERQNQLTAGNAITQANIGDIQRRYSAADSLANRQQQSLLFAPSFAAEQSGWGPLQRYLAAISGTGLGTSTSGSSTQPYYSNPTGEAAGALGTGALGASLLFGKSGVFPGALQSGYNSASDYLSGLFSSGGGGDTPALASELLSNGGYFAGY